MIIKNKVEYNLDKAELAIEIFKEYFKNELSKALVTYPDTIKYGSKEYFIYVFYSCMLDYGMKSSYYHDNLIKTYKKFPEIFNPSYVVKNPDMLDDIIRNSVHVRYPRVAKTKWLKLSEFLTKESDLKTRINNIESYKELSDYIDSTKSFGQKTGGLLKRLIADAVGKYTIDDIPIDRHDIEISYLLGVVNESDLSETEIKELSDVWVNASKNMGINPSLVDQYLWTIGVDFCTNKNCDACPLKKICMHK